MSQPPTASYNAEATQLLLRTYSFTSPLPAGFPDEVLAQGADPNATDISGTPVIHYATAQNNPDHIRTLVRYGADIDKRTDFDNTALHMACKNSKLDAARTLLELGANPTLRTRTGDTALHCCAHWPAGHYDSEADIYLYAHPLTDLYATNDAGQTPLELACSQNANRLAARIAQHGAYIPPRLASDPALRDRYRQAQKCWQTFCDAPHSPTHDELMYFANIGMLSEALSPARWEGKHDTLITLFESLHPCHQSDVLHTCPTLLRLLADTPTSHIFHITHMLPHHRDTYVQ